MKLPQKRSERIAALILIGLFLGVTVVAGIGAYLINRTPRLIPLEDALWVTDWNLEKIHGPGTPQQLMILRQLTGPEGPKLNFSAPVLYRMGGTNTSQVTEGILLYGFDPKRPEMALMLAAEQEPPTKSR